MDFKGRRNVLNSKKNVYEKLILTIFDLVKKIIIETDINKIVLVVILNYPDEKRRLYSIIFYFKKFTSPELNYDIYYKKLSTIVDNFKI